MICFDHAADGYTLNLRLNRATSLAAQSTQNMEQLSGDLSPPQSLVRSRFMHSYANHGEPSDRADGSSVVPALERDIQN